MPSCSAYDLLHPSNAGATIKCGEFSPVQDASRKRCMPSYHTMPALISITHAPRVLPPAGLAVSSGTRQRQHDTKTLSTSTFCTVLFCAVLCGGKRNAICDGYRQKQARCAKYARLRITSRRKNSCLQNTF